MKRILAASLLCGATLSTTMTPISANDLDFFNQLRAINVCQTQWSTQHPGKAITDERLVACISTTASPFSTPSLKSSKWSNFIGAHSCAWAVSFACRIAVVASASTMIAFSMPTRWLGRNQAFEPPPASCVHHQIDMIDP
jgi:hypothetical protein